MDDRVARLAALEGISLEQAREWFGEQSAEDREADLADPSNCGICGGPLDDPSKEPQVTVRGGKGREAHAECAAELYYDWDCEVCGGPLEDGGDKVLVRGGRPAHAECIVELLMEEGKQ